MKKFMYLVLVITVVMSLAGVSAAADSQQAVLEDEMLRDEAGEQAATSELAPDTVVGEDIEIEEGEDIEIEEGEAKIVSLPVDSGSGDGSGAVPLDELLMEEQKRVDAANEADGAGEAAEANIVSAEEDEKEPFGWPLAAGIAGAVVVVGGIVLLLIKKYT